MQKSLLRNILGEPLLHFVLIGGALFAGYHGWGQRSAAPDTVHVTSADIQRLTGLWSKQWNRAPSVQEQQDLIGDHLKEILLAREAVALGLDQDDIIVQRRLAQKMKFLLEDTVRIAEPGAAVLREFHARHAGLFQERARVSLTQHFFSSQDAAQKGLHVLQQNEAADVGEPTLLEQDIHAIDQPILANLFGAAFAGQVFALEPAHWHGPIASGYGYHLVRINRHDAARPLPFEEVRERVLAEWTRVEQEKAEQQYFAGLLQKYQVEVDEALRPVLGPDRVSQVAQ